MDELKLKPCPFCGGRAIMKIQKHIPNGYDYTPTCQDPSCAGRLTKKWTNEAVAIEAWNKRKSGSAEEKLKAFWDGMSAEMKEERKRGKWLPHPGDEDFDVCSVCGTGCKRRERGISQYIPWVTEYNYQFCPHCGADMRGE